MGKLVFSGDYVLIHEKDLPRDLAWAAGLNAEVLRVHPSGLVEIRLLNSRTETLFELPESCCEKVQLESYEVTTSHIGAVRNILAMDISQAMSITDRLVPYESVDWGDDWTAVDADLEKETEPE